jgi:hypothetical protein
LIGYFFLFVSLYPILVSISLQDWMAKSWKSRYSIVLKECWAGPGYVSLAMYKQGFILLLHLGWGVLFRKNKEEE